MLSRISSTSRKRSVRIARCRSPLPLTGARLNRVRYIFTDLAPAGDLFSYAQSHGGHLDDYNARVVTLQIALAVEYLHSQGIAHRDIKQENVLVTSTDFGGRVLLTDFGFAAYANVSNGRMLSKVGTEGFAAP
jgi:serine/threonine protein kinase